jgi:radical SAM protein with 4Fe4S-binding SPASM domain
VSIDGNSEETMRANRGVSLARGEGVRHYHELRNASGMARRPRLGFSWTLKRNNIHELPDFIERVAEFEPDRLYSRHLLVFFEKDQDQSLVGEVDLVNRYLRPAYAAMERLGMVSDCPPLMAETTKAQATEATPEPKPPSARERDRCPFVHRTGVLSSNGDVLICANMFAEIAGSVADGRPFQDVWNGPVLTEVRSALDTPHEWDACRSCWFREVQYASQRDAAARRERFDLDNPGEITEEAWDFRRHRK